MKSTFTLKFCLMLLLSAPLWVAAQTGLKLDAKGSSMLVEGTSNVHDWEITVTGMAGNGQAMFTDGTLTDIQSFSFQVPVKGLKSGKDKMDKNTYEALKDEANPNLRFKLTGVQNLRASGTTYHFTATGSLSLAGKTRSISFPATATYAPGGALKVSAKVDIHMPDYQIEPPTALFGTITTGADVTVKFNTTLETSDQAQ